MSSSGAVTLADYPGDVIVLACEKCERRGLYRKDRLVAEHGPNMKLPDLRHRLAADCPRVENPIGNIGCGAIYPELRSRPPRLDVGVTLTERS